MPKPVITVFALALAMSVTATQLAAQDLLALGEAQALLQEIQQLESALEDMESQLGPFSERLLEPLLSIENRYRELGDDGRVREIQLRRLQLLRTSRGLEHPDTIPLLETMIGTEIRLGNWEAVSDHLDHLLTVALENYAADSDEVMLAMQRQASWYLTRVYLDRDRDRAEHFMEAREIYDDLLDLAEDKYGEDDPALIPFLYQRAFSLSQQVAMLNSEGSLRGDAIDETIREDGPGRLETATRGGLFPSTSLFGPSSRVPIVNGQEPVGVAYLRLASGYIDDIRDIAEAQGDWETWAIATIYYGDYSFLRGRNSGRSEYREAREKLLESGISEERLERFFNRPMPIPLQNFYTRFADLEAYQAQLVDGLHLIVAEGEIEEFDPGEPWQEPVHIGRFLAWEEDVGSVPRPLLEDPIFAMELPLALVDLSFRVNGNGKVSGIDVLHAEPDERRLRRDAVRAARIMRFRPAFYEGRSRARPEVQLRYMIQPED